MLPKTDLPLIRAIGRTIAETRAHRGLTQEQLAERIGTSSDVIAKLERGLHVPRFRTLIAVSRELRVPIRDLLDQELLMGGSNENHRTRIELRGRLLLRDLSDDFLEIAVVQLAALAKGDPPSMTND